MKTQFDFLGNVKKVATQAAKGGSIVLTLEMPLTEENAMLASTQNKDCAVSLRFDNQSVEEAQGQGELDFGEEEM